MYFCSGEMAERSNAVVLKTIVPQGTGGSNPSLSAMDEKPRVCEAFFFNPSEVYFGKELKKKPSRRVADWLLIHEALPLGWRSNPFNNPSEVYFGKELKKKPSRRVADWLFLLEQVWDSKFRIKQRWQEEKSVSIV
jgi:hypothetical protein